MPSTTYIPGTIVTAVWLNEVNVAVFNTIPTLALATNGTLTNPTLVTPILGVATATSINKYTFTQPATAATLTIADGKTFTANASITMAGTDGTTLTVGPSGGTVQGGGTNTGDQNLFSTIAVATQSDIVADSLTDTLTVAAGAGIALTTNAGTDTLTITNTAVSALVLVAGPVTPTVAASVDFLSTFTASYDNYLVIIDGVRPTTTDSLVLRYAVGGVAVSTSVYYSAFPSGSVITTSATQASMAATVLNTGGGISGMAQLLNVNSTTRDKQVLFNSAHQLNATPGFLSNIQHTQFNNTAATTGFQLRWLGGNTFEAAGTIRVYGYSNT